MVCAQSGQLSGQSAAGKCKAEVDQYCFEIKPGEGRLAKCIQQQLEEQTKSENKDAKVTDDCKQELDDFLIDRSGEISKRVLLPQGLFQIPCYCRPVHISTFAFCTAACTSFMEIP